MKLPGKFFAAALLIHLAVTTARADTIDYRFSSAPNDLVTNSYNYGGVTVTGGPGALFVNVSNGLSVFGDNQYAIDYQEFIDFSFNAGSATGISLFTQGGPFATINIAAYGFGGYLGLQTVNVTGLGPAMNISSLFSNQAISHFTMTTASGAQRPYILNFTPSASVPDAASTIALLAASVALMAVARSRRRLAQ